MRAKSAGAEQKKKSCQIYLFLVRGGYGSNAKRLLLFAPPVISSFFKRKIALTFLIFEISILVYIFLSLFLFRRHKYPEFMAVVLCFFFIFLWPGFEFGLCIFYALSIPTELSSRGPVVLCLVSIIDV